MKNERWATIETLFHAARELKPNEQRRFLDEVCSSDPGLRHKIEVLLRQNDSADEFLNNPIAVVAREWPASTLDKTIEALALPSLASPNQTLLQPGDLLGGRRLVRYLGRGGFGEVWEAEEIGSGRRLALKVLTGLRAASPQMLLAFKREGRLAASINHPRSVYVFGVEENQGQPLIAMELLSAGTLKDLLIERGKLPAKEAVDFILDIIEGLEALQAVGIVHRDIKPSNCFIGDDGRAKIGDFGISKLLQPENAATITESFVGTPTYASPEHVRGRNMDFRSDIYSVGATLYTLLTGKPPFEGDSAGELLARIVSEEPIPLSMREVRVPKGLAQIIRRCMAKDREKRYGSYAAMRADLLPFSSAGELTPGNLVRRSVAFAIDETAVVLGVSTLFGLAATGLQGAYGSILAHLTYYLIFEALWGRTPGKYLMGLRVVTAPGATITFRDAALRTALFGAILLPAIIVHGIIGPAPFMSLVTILAFLTTMRRENGFAGPHEIVSKTRVMTVRWTTADSVQVLQPDQNPIADAARAEWFGPYRALKDVWRTEAEALVLAFDDVLHRNVWIHTTTPRGKGRNANRLAAGRRGKLRWLQAGQASSDWSAFEAPTGMSFCDWVRLQGRLSWVETYSVLPGIVEEIEARLEEPPFYCSLQHIWMDAQGRPKILEFPASLESAGSTAAIHAGNAGAFVSQVLDFALTGDAAPLERPDRTPPAVPLPEHARTFVAQLCDPARGPSKIGMIRSELHRLSGRPVEVSRTAKAGMLAVVAALPVILWAGFSFKPLIDSIRMPVWEQELQRVPIYDGRYRSLNDYRNLEAAATQKEAVCKVLAWIRREAGGHPRGRYLMSQMRMFQRETLESCGNRHPSIAEPEAMEARKILDRACLCVDTWYSAARFQQGAGVLFWAGGFLWLFPVAVSFFFPPGCFARMSGFALQTTNGKPADRLRCLKRSVFAWSPFALFFPALAGVGLLGYAPNAAVYWKSEGVLASTFLLHGYASVLGIVEVALGSLVVAGMIYAIARPQRGLPDLLAGTCLVPK
jgi:hypothetical protein